MLSRLVSLSFIEDEIRKISRAFNPHKTHGYDDISIRMIKICDKSLLEPLIILFKNSTKSSHYLEKIYGKDLLIYLYIRRMISSYKLPTNISFTNFCKKFWKNIFNKIYWFLNEKKLLNPNQSGFRPSNSCINQLLAHEMTHEIFEAFYCNPLLKVRSVFLNISKAFDKVW